MSFPSLKSKRTPSPNSERSMAGNGNCRRIEVAISMGSENSHPNGAPKTSRNGITQPVLNTKSQQAHLQARKFVVAKKHSVQSQPRRGLSLSNGSSTDPAVIRRRVRNTIYEVQFLEMSEPIREDNLGADIIDLALPTRADGELSGSATSTPKDSEGSSQDLFSFTEDLSTESLGDAVKKIPLSEGSVKNLVKNFERLMSPSGSGIAERNGHSANTMDNDSKLVLQKHEPESRSDSSQRERTNASSVVILVDLNHCKSVEGSAVGVPDSSSLRSVEERPNTSSVESSVDFSHRESVEGSTVDRSDSPSLRFVGASVSSFGDGVKRRNEVKNPHCQGRGSSLRKNETGSQKKAIKATSPQPFKLQTEERGHIKEQKFMKRFQEKLSEEEKLRIPIAQALPLTTDEPQTLKKPAVKERTKALDIKLRSGSRAVKRAEFDHFMANRIQLMEERRLQKEKQQKLAEEEEIKKLRKELIPRAQLLPYFDRPFVPKRSTKCRTIPKEPKFHQLHTNRANC